MADASDQANANRDAIAQQLMQQQPQHWDMDMGWVANDGAVLGRGVSGASVGGVGGGYSAPAAAPPDMSAYYQAQASPAAAGAPDMGAYYQAIADQWQQQALVNRAAAAQLRDTPRPAPAGAQPLQVAGAPWFDMSTGWNYPVSGGGSGDSGGVGVGGSVGGIGGTGVGAGSVGSSAPGPGPGIGGPPGGFGAALAAAIAAQQAEANPAMTAPISSFDQAFSGFAPALGDPTVSVSETTTGFEGMTNAAVAQAEAEAASNPGIGDEGEGEGDGY
jgi:hypothetical protein